MDFLDPKKKKYRSVKLAIGHTLMVLLVGIVTYILVSLAYGFHLDRKTGEIIQNGLVFIDSAPEGAKIKINGQAHKDNTNTRVALPEGKYTIVISKDGYRDWEKTFNLEGGEVLRFTYPALFPKDLQSEQLQAFSKDVVFSTQSPDHRWVLLWQKNNLSSPTLYDLEKRKNDKPSASTLSFSGEIFTSSKNKHTLKLVEWSTDNKHILIEHNWVKGHEFIMLNRDKPGESFNINNQLDINPSRVALRDKKFDSLYLYDSSKKILSVADVKSQKVTAYAQNIVNFKSHGKDTVLMATLNSSDPSKASIVLQSGDKKYNLREIPFSSYIPLDITQFKNDWYVVIGVAAQNKSFVYKNPINLLGDHTKLRSVGAVTLRSPGEINDISFSNNARFILARSGQHFSVYDAEYKSLYGYDINHPIDKGSEPAWMDGHRLMYSSKGKLIVFDYDGINLRTLVGINAADKAMFDRDYTELYSLSKTAGKQAKTSLFLTQLRLPGDK